jgi:hypothetical protein
LPASIGDNPSGIDPLHDHQDERSPLMVASTCPRWHHLERMSLVGHVWDVPMRASPRDAVRRPPSPRVGGYARPACSWGEPGSVWRASPPVRPSGAPAAALRAVGIAEWPASALTRQRPKPDLRAFGAGRISGERGATVARPKGGSRPQHLSRRLPASWRAAIATRAMHPGHSSRKSVISAVTVPQPADSRACSEP